MGNRRYKGSGEKEVGGKGGKGMDVKGGAERERGTTSHILRVGM